jgi:hypothetical protein
VVGPNAETGHKLLITDGNAADSGLPPLKVEPAREAGRPPE